MTLKAILRFPVTVVEFVFGLLFIVYFFLKKQIVALGAWSFLTPKTPGPKVAAPEEKRLIQPDEAMKLFAAIENQKLKELKEQVYVLAVNISSLIETNRQHQEFLVHIATLHEELLNQLDQGKVVMVKRAGGHEEEKQQARQQTSSPFDMSSKKKQVLN